MARDDRLREYRISGERVYSGAILDLDVDRVRLPNGTETVREVVRHRGAVVVLPLQEDGRLQLVRQYRYPAASDVLELPAGKLEPGEDASSCAVRELAEETGWRAVEIHALGSFFTTPGFTDEILHAFVATRLKPAPDVAHDPDEAIEVVSMTIGDTLEACRDGTIRDAKTIATLFLAQLNGWI